MVTQVKQHCRSDTSTGQYRYRNVGPRRIHGGSYFVGCGTNKMDPEETHSARSAARPTTSSDLVAEGQRIFRFDTFGDEQFWTDALRLNEVVEKERGPDDCALAVGLKVDADVLPPRGFSSLKEEGRSQEPGDNGRSASR